MINLRDYQVECLSAIKTHFEKGSTRQLVSLPTGAGKTVIFASLIKETGKKTLVIAHTNELLKQAKDKNSNDMPRVRSGHRERRE